MASNTPVRRRRRFTPKLRRNLLLFLLFAGPNIALILVFVYWPLIRNFQMSTWNYVLGSPTATEIGFGNYIEFFTSSDAAEVLGITGIFTLFTVGGAMVLGLLLATVLNRKIKGQTFARAAVFAPYVLSGVGVGMVWLFIFDPIYGALSFVLRAVGQASPQWINDPQLALTMVIIVYVWKNLGYCAVVYLAGMQALNPSVMEAASLDGAGPVRRFFSMSLPLLSPTTFFLLITSLLSSLQAFDILRVMTPLGNGTRTLIYEAYLQAFSTANRAGYSAALSTILFAILLIVTVIQMRIIEKRVHYS